MSTTSTVAHQFFFGDKKQHEDAPRFFMLSTAPAKVVAFLLTATASGVSTAAEPTYIVALGASGIHGKGVSLNEAFPAQLESMLRAAGFNVQVINAGVDGDTTTGMLLRMDSVIPDGTRITILQPGSNDFKSRKHGLSVEQHLANVEAIVSRLRAQHIQVVLCGDDPASAALARRYDAISISCSDSHGSTVST